MNIPWMQYGYEMAESQLAIGPVYLWNTFSSENPNGNIANDEAQKIWQTIWSCGLTVVAREVLRGTLFGNGDRHFANISVGHH